MFSIQEMQYAIEVLHYVGPPIGLLYYTIATVISICTLQTYKNSNGRKIQKLAVYLMLSVGVTYFGEASMLVYDTFKGQPRTSTTDSNVRS